MLATTKIIGLKAFRTNITSLWKTAQSKNIRYIVMHHSQPIFEVNPVTANIADQLAADITKARKQAKTKQIYSQKKVFKMLGL